MNDNLKNLILDRLEKEEKILITGASGWLGRETIELIAETLGDKFLNRIILVGSTSKSIKVNNINYSIIPLNSIRQYRYKFGIILHLAFLSQDKTEKLGVEKYMEINEEITSSILQVTLESGTRYIFVASSGAAATHILEAQKHAGKKMYGESKLNAENRFLALNSVQVLIGRIWSISGNQIREPLKYAIGNFIYQAVNTGTIHLTGSALSTRTYIDAKQMMTGYIFQLLTSTDFLLNSGGTTTYLHGLAAQTLLQCNPDGLIVLSNQLDNRPDYYISPDNKMKQILNHYSI
jgi:nucleoside-diphosphate-sugar epimerase